MAYYKEYSANAIRIFYYRFTCEHCGKTTDWAKEEVKRTAYFRMHQSVHRGLTPQEESDLHKAALCKVNEAYTKAKECAKNGNYIKMMEVVSGTNEDGAGYRGTNTKSLKNQCPACGKTQSWETLMNWGFVKWTGIGVLGGLLFEIGKGALNGQEVFDNIRISTILICGAVGIALDIITGIIKKGKAPKVQKNKPEFMWE